MLAVAARLLAWWVVRAATVMARREAARREAAREAARQSLVSHPIDIDSFDPGTGHDLVDPEDI